MVYIKSNNENSFLFSTDNVNFISLPSLYELSFVNNLVRCSIVEKGYLLFKNLKVNDVIVDGIIYNSFEELSFVLTSILFMEDPSSNTDLQYIVNEVFEEPKIRIKAGIVAILDVNTVTFPFQTIDFSSELSAGNWKIIYPEIATSSLQKTGTEISFITTDIYGTFTIPDSDNITVNLTDAKLGIVQKMYHKNATEPTFPTGFVKLNGDYIPDSKNIIYFEFSEDERVEYWIINL
jgi:hypothetical protein